MLNIFRSFVPKDYQSLLDYISPAAFKVINWREAASQFLTLSKDLLDKSELSNLIAAVEPLLPKNITISQSELDSVDVKESHLKTVGETVLDIYFSQFFSPKGICLDLRLKHFTEIDGQLQWHLSPLRHTFSKEFRIGMLRMYEGFYLDKPEQLRIGMQKTGLVPASAPPELFEATKELVFAHFGTAGSEQVVFSLEKFRLSFHDLFIHLKKHEIQLPADFLFLGVYLVTLYSSLENSKSSHCVKDIFLASWERNAERLNAASTSSEPDDNGSSRN